MRPYDGVHHPGVDTTTLTEKICGYQGRFATEGDGSGRRWVHYGREKWEFFYFVGRIKVTFNGHANFIGPQSDYGVVEAARSNAIKPVSEIASTCAASG